MIKGIVKGLAWLVAFIGVLLTLAFAIPRALIYSNDIDRKIYSSTFNTIYGPHYLSYLIEDKVDLTPDVIQPGLDEAGFKELMRSNKYVQQTRKHQSHVFVKRTKKIACDTDLVILAYFNEDSELYAAQGYRADHIDSFCWGT